MPRKAAGKPARRKTEILAAVNPAGSHDAEDAAATFPIVALGASAGGLEALRRLLDALPGNTGMAFVAIQHLHPGHASMLSEILARSTKMPVRQVENNMVVEPSAVYVIPPGKNMVLSHGALQLAPRTVTRGQHHPIDHFMRSLAEERGHTGIGVVLSGTGSDGTLGLQEMKAAGGITFAQDDSAEQKAMPRSAVAGGAVDYVLSPEGIASEIARIGHHPFIAPYGDALHRDIPRNEPALQGVLEIVRREMGIDFFNYKRTTVQRRILRRMVLGKLNNLHDYVEFLREHPEEVEALHRDILINVTSFFRNPDAYEWVKENVFPRLAEGRSRQDALRVWALGCSTGEEAYSIAMAFTEFVESSRKRVGMQVFATDLNGAGIEKARSGIYSRGIEQDVSPERLQRFFTDVDGSYRIAKPIRDMCVFARQNVLVDPPFSRLDLVVCRNLLIYLEPVMQQRLLRIVHYGLRPDGQLWLGAAESASSAKELFETESSKFKVYRRKPGDTGPIAVARERGRREPAAIKLPTGPSVAEAIAHPRHAQSEADRVLLTRYAPASVVVDSNLEILQFRGDTAPYLAAPPGRATLSLNKMLRAGLLEPVQASVARAKREGRAIREDGLKVKAEHGVRTVNLVIVPLKEGSGDLVVMFEEPGLVVAAQADQRKVDATAEGRKKRGKPARAETPSSRAERLKRELDSTREYLESLVQDHEAAIEELQAASEEVQSTNEELQSVNEELETSQEELQSSNEELATVNDELTSRNEELTRVNADLASLISSVEMPIILLDWDLRIRRYTKAAEQLLKLIASDIGRPLTDIKLNVDVPDVEELFGSVLGSVGSVDREVRDRHGHWWSMRIRQYKTGRHKVEGIVLMFVDIDAAKRASEAIAESDARFKALADSTPALIWVDDKAGRQFVNRTFEEFVGVPEATLVKAGWTAYIHAEDRDGFLAAYEAASKARQPFELTCRLRRADGAYRWMRTTAIPRVVAGDFAGFVGCSVDVTDLMEADGALREADKAKDEFLGMLAHELRNPLAALGNAAYLVTEAKGAGPTAASALGIIDRQMRNMTRIVDDLLDVSRITHGKIHLRTERIDLQAAVRDVVNGSAYERTHVQQKLTLHLPEEPLWIEADPARFDQILANLLGNAAKFTPEGGHVWLTVEKEAGGKGEASFAVIRVRDDGGGIEASNLARVFDLFVQGKSGGESRGGVGIGLALVQRLVQLHGGTVEAFSEGEGKGSEFVVRLPLAETAGKARPEPRRAAAAGSRRVLVVDDNEDAAESLRTVLEHAGHETRVAVDGAAAIAAARSFKPQIVLLDIGLPDMDGYAVAKKLRAAKGGGPAFLVALTGYGRADDVELARLAGFDEHLTKPADPERVLALISMA